MLDAKLTVETLRSIFEPITAVVNKTEVKCHSGGLTISATQPAEMAIGQITVPSAAFDIYETENVVIGVKVPKLLNYLNGFPSDNLITLTVNDDQTNLRLQSPALTYNCALEDPRSIWTPTTIPSIKSSVDIEVAGADLNRVVTAAEWISLHLTLTMESATNNLHCEATGDNDSVSLTIKPNSISHSGVDVHSTYPLKYLHPIQHVIPDAADVQITLGSGTPIRMRFSPSEHSGHAMYYIRPV